jgi:uncharacterized protein (DUF2062 family)/trans-aconitate methyltransferase
VSPRLGRRFPLRRPGRALAELHHRLRTEGDAPAAKALSVGIGTAIGCLPLYGLHLPLCLVASRLLRLSLVRTYLAAHVNNPLTAPLLLYVQLALGRWLAGGGWPAPTPEELAGAGGWSWSTAGREVMVGGLAFGLALGGALGLAAWAVGRRWRRPPFEAALIEATAWRYLDAGIATWEFVRGKLHRDPVYLALLASGELPRRGRLVDLGCGHGIALALLATAAEWPAAERAAAGPPAPDWPAGWPAPPAGLELLGIERAPKRAAAARSALGAAAEVRQGDLAAAEIPACDAALLLDVLHYLGAADQAALLDRSARALVPGGVLLVREADAAGGLRFALTRAAERLAALARGRWRQRFHYRSAGEWARLLAARGLEVETRPMGRGTPFANVLLVARKPGSSAGPGVPTGPGPSSGR